MMTKQLQPSASYVTLLTEIKERVHSAQVCAAFAVNGELILLYWQVGRDISSRFDAEGWGTKVIDRLAKGIGAEFPGVEGFSVWNLRYRRSFAEAWPEPEILQQLIAKLPWGRKPSGLGLDQGSPHTRMLPESGSRKRTGPKRPRPPYFYASA